MKKLLPLIICLLVIAIPCGAQWPRKDESYDQQWNLQERARNARKDKDEDSSPSSSDYTIYPSLSMREGKGFYGGRAKVTLNNKAGFINRAGQLVIEARFDDAGRFSEGLAPVEINGKWGYIDKEGDVVIPLKFDWALGFYEGRALIMVKDKWGHIDAKGAVVVEPRFDEAGSFSEGVARVCIYDENYKWGFIDKVGKYKWGFIDKAGNWVLKPVYDSPVEDFSHGRAPVGKDIGMNNGVVVDKFYVDKKGRSYPEPEPDERFEDFDDIDPFFEGLAAFRRDYKYGFVNRRAGIVIAPQFEMAGIFSEGLAPVEIDKGQEHRGDWGYINRKGQHVIKSQFDWAWEFSEGRALVAVGDQVGYIDRAGRYIWKPSK